MKLFSAQHAALECFYHFGTAADGRLKRTVRQSD